MVKIICASMDKKIVAAAVGMGVALLVWYIIKRRNDHFVSSTYGVSCMQLCSIAHPGGPSTCEQDGHHPGCETYRGCIRECRMDQSKLEQEASSLDKGEEWDGRYGKLIS